MDSAISVRVGMSGEQSPTSYRRHNIYLQKLQGNRKGQTPIKAGSLQRKPKVQLYMLNNNITCNDNI